LSAVKPTLFCLFAACTKAVRTLGAALPKLGVSRSTSGRKMNKTLNKWEKNIGPTFAFCLSEPPRIGDIA
jgi:hypothetical protein